MRELFLICNDYKLKIILNLIVFLQRMYLFKPMCFLMFSDRGIYVVFQIAWQKWSKLHYRYEFHQKTLIFAQIADKFSHLLKRIEHV